MFMPWTDAYLTGVAEIDKQHRWLVDMTNNLHDELEKAEPDQKVIGDIVYGLVDYATNHFILEENLFSQHGYPESKEHIDEHNKFNQTAAALLGKHEAGEMVTTDAMTFLKDWLNHHILEIDKAYVPFFKEKGVA